MTQVRYSFRSLQNMSPTSLAFLFFVLSATVGQQQQLLPPKVYCFHRGSANVVGFFLSNLFEDSIRFKKIRIATI